MTVAEIVPNEEQQQAEQDLLQFLVNPAEKEARISGPAGTGKTTLMKRVMTNVLKDYESYCIALDLPVITYEVALTATTNKAAEVLTQATGREASTIHSFLGLKLKDDYKTGEQIIERTASAIVHSHKLIFVDEASMVDAKLYDFIHKLTDKTCKIIYLGDHCQLAPVKETLSKVYSDTMPTSDLRKPMRNAEQPILMDLCRALREITVEQGKFFQIPEHPGVIDYVSGPSADQFIQEEFLQGEPTARILAYSNNRVHFYNAGIRALRQLPNKFTEGEILVNNKGYAIGEHQLSVERLVLIHSISEDHKDKELPDNGLLPYWEAQVAGQVGRGSFSNRFTVRIPCDMEHYNQMMKYYARKKDWESYFHLKNYYVDLRPKDASTVYKAQGSTYDTVMIDLTNIGTCTNSDQLARMLYVAASRARNRVVLFGSLPPRLFK